MSVRTTSEIIEEMVQATMPVPGMYVSKANEAFYAHRRANAANKAIIDLCAVVDAQEQMIVALMQIVTELARLTSDGLAAVEERLR